MGSGEPDGGVIRFRGVPCSVKHETGIVVILQILHFVNILIVEQKPAVTDVIGKLL